MSRAGLNRFKDLTFDDFKKLAQDNTLSQYEKIGFPDSYREGKEELIFLDIVRKLGNLTQENKTILDIGPGCSGPAFMMIDLCRKKGHRLILVDSREMLAQLPNEHFIVKVPGKYPTECKQLFEEYAQRVDALLTYSVFHYIFAELNPFEFLDKSLGLLANGGELLIGDIPNISMRKRFFGSANGIHFHQAFTGTTEIPVVQFNTLDQAAIDDSVILSMLSHCRNSGFDAYVLPQPIELPMANRREDVLIKKP